MNLGQVFRAAKSSGASPYSILEAAYVWLERHYDGQASEEYAALCQLTRVFSPSLSVERGRLDDDAIEAYAAINNEAFGTDGLEYDIVFLQNEEDFADFPGGQDGFFAADHDEMASYLAQWDAGDYGERSVPHTRQGSHDCVVAVNGYVLTYNSTFGYAALGVIR